MIKILVYQGIPNDKTTYWQITNPNMFPQFVFVAQNPSNPDYFLLSNYLLTSIRIFGQA
jgi:hypothetical protein